MTNPAEILSKYWGYSAFRPLQEDIVKAVVAGRDTLALLPTGGGKSICYQVPGLMLDGLCIVISPLLALMKDQLEGLRSRGIIAETVNSQVSRRDIDRILDNCIYGEVKFLFIAPERIGNELFLARLEKMQVGLIAVDEAHCISQWGHEFRPAYRKIAQIRELRPHTPVIALTATATPEVVEDIQEQLGFKQKHVLQKSFARENIAFSVKETEDKRGIVLEHIREMKEGSGIIYVRNRRRCRELSEMLQANGIPSNYYHAGMSTDARTKAQEDWLDNRVKVVVATNAFGMGIDKPDVRLVIHYDLSDSLESYYQEAGRAGRDGKASRALQVFNQSDIDDTRRNLQRSYPNAETVKHVYQVMSDRFGLAAGSGELETFGLDLATLAKHARCDMMSTLGSLKILEQNGYIQLHRGLREPSRLQMQLDQSRLLSLQDDSSDLGRLIHALMRHRTGLYQSPVAIREEELSTLTGLPVKSVMLLLDQAAKRGILDYAPRKGSSSLTYLTPRLSQEALRLDTKLMREMQERTVGKQSALIRYLHNDLDCRMAQMLFYFGEKVEEGCGLCDVCRAAGKHADSPKGNVLLYQIREFLNEERELEILRSRFSLNEERNAKIFRWALDKGFIKLDGQQVKWTGPRG